jgi:integrase/recombinase XerD
MNEHCGETLRHSYATHMLEAGVNVVVLQRLLGHANLATTAGYLHVSVRELARTPSLLDLLVVPREEPSRGSNEGSNEGSSGGRP